MFSLSKRILQGLLILLCGVTQIVSAQSITADSLYTLPFDDMDRVFKTLPKTEQEQLAQAYLQKAKQEGDDYEKANGYYLKSLIDSYKENGVAYADSIIRVSNSTQKYPYPGLGYLQKGISQYYVSKDELAFSSYAAANKHFLRVKDSFNLLRVQHYIALLKNIINRHQEALPVFEKNMKFFEKEEHRKKYN